jgi:glycosyltransferase involved in cell wall biosynthesis
MKVHFLQPPPEQRAGGLDAAIAAMCAALQRAGVEVTGEPPEPGNDTVAHFHGLWQPRHAHLSALCAEWGLPTVVSPHGMLEPWAWRHKRWKKWPYFHAVEKHHLRRAAALLATAPSEAARLRDFVCGARVEVLPLGLTGGAQPDYARARAALGWAAEERVLLYLSRLHVKKGLELLLDALAHPERRPRTRVVIVGGGEPAYLAQLRAYANRLHARLPIIDWVGEVWGDNKWKYFQGADLFCLPSYSENFGLAVLEALQVGTPVLTTTTTPWAVAISDDRGYIAEPTVTSIKEQLDRYFSAPPWTPADRARLSAWTWEKFHWDTLAPRYLELYRSFFDEK